MSKGAQKTGGGGSKKPQGQAPPCQQTRLPADFVAIGLPPANPRAGMDPTKIRTKTPKA